MSLLINSCIMVFNWQKIFKILLIRKRLKNLSINWISINLSTFLKMAYFLISWTYLLSHLRALPTKSNWQNLWDNSSNLNSFHLSVPERRCFVIKQILEEVNRHTKLGLIIHPSPHLFLRPNLMNLIRG